ncbi:MAG: peptidylprolyl isomerase [Bryobacteraceae bacterium]
MRWTSSRSIVAFGCLLLSACSQTETKSSAPAKSAQPAHAPDIYRVNLDTSKGAVAVEVTRDWAPRGADRFFELVKAGYYDGDRFYRVVPRFVIQFGINGEPKVAQLWSSLRILDDPVKQKNRKGTLTFASSGTAGRTTQVFVNMRDNLSLDREGFAPFGRVVSGMDVLERLYGGYGDIPPRGSGPDGVEIERQGNVYLDNHFPRLDYIRKATIP